MPQTIPEIQFGDEPAWALVEVKDGHARIVDSHGPVEIVTREPCAGGHAVNDECDLCRGERIGEIEYEPGAVELPAC